MRTTSPREPHRRAFTLIELLVTIFIIAILLAIILPALRHAMLTARGTKCAANLRQIAVAANAYAIHNDDRLLGAQLVAATDDPNTVIISWLPSSLARSTAEALMRQYGLSIDEQGYCPLVDADVWKDWYTEYDIGSPPHPDPLRNGIDIQYALLAGSMDDQFPSSWSSDSYPLWDTSDTTAPPAPARACRAAPTSVLAADTNIYSRQRTSLWMWASHSERHRYAEEDGITVHGFADSPVLSQWTNSNRAHADGSVASNPSASCGRDDGTPGHENNQARMHKTKGSFTPRLYFYW